MFSKLPQVNFYFETKLSFHKSILDFSYVICMSYQSFFWCLAGIYNHFIASFGFKHHPTILVCFLRLFLLNRFRPYWRNDLRMDWTKEDDHLMFTCSGFWMVFDCHVFFWINLYFICRQVHFVLGYSLDDVSANGVCLRNCSSRF